MADVITSNITLKPQDGWVLISPTSVGSFLRISHIPAHVPIFLTVADSLPTTLGVGFRVDCDSVHFDGGFTGNLYARIANNSNAAVIISVWQNPNASGGGGGGGGAVTAASGSYVAGSIVDLGTGTTPAANTVNSNLKQLHTDLTTGHNSSTGTTTQVAGSASSVTVLAANSARLGATIVNDSSATLFLLLKTGGTASTTVYTVPMAAKGSVGAYYEVPFNYTGAVIGIWSAAAGNAVVTEFTA